MDTYLSVSITHWGRVTYTCVSKLAIIGSNNGLSPGRRQAIFWSNAGIVLIGRLGTNCGEILIEVHAVSFKENAFEKLSRPQCVKRYENNIPPTSPPLGTKHVKVSLVTTQIIACNPISYFYNNQLARNSSKRKYRHYDSVTCYARFAFQWHAVHIRRRKSLSTYTSPTKSLWTLAPARNVWQALYWRADISRAKHRRLLKFGSILYHMVF